MAKPITVYLRRFYCNDVECGSIFIYRNQRNATKAIKDVMAWTKREHNPEDLKLEMNLDGHMNLEILSILSYTDSRGIKCKYVTTMTKTED